MDESTNTASSFAQSSNIIQFPKSRTRPFLIAEDEAAKEATRRAYVDEVVEAYAISLLNKLAQQGFSVFEDQFDKHYGFTMEALRSTLLLTFGLGHPLQDVIDKTVKLIEEIEANDNDDEVE